MCRQLLEGLANTMTHPGVIGILDEMGLDDCADLSPAVTEYAQSHGFKITRLPEVARHLCDAAKALPPLSDVMLVNYFWQASSIKPMSEIPLVILTLRLTSSTLPHMASSRFAEYFWQASFRAEIRNPQESKTAKP